MLPFIDALLFIYTKGQRINFEGTKSYKMFSLCVSAHLILLQESKFNGDVIAHLLILFTMHLESDLRLLDLGQCGGVSWTEIQFLQICTICIIFNSAAERKGDRSASVKPTASHQAVKSHDVVIIN